MLIDARQLPDRHEVRADVVIVGAGPAGMTAAREFLGTGLTVALLESGHFEDDDGIQDLADESAMNDGDIYPGARWMRNRRVGGTANQWAHNLSGKQPQLKTPVTSAQVPQVNAPVDDTAHLGVRYVPLAEIDFEKREGLPNTGWPITRADLDPYYRRAHDVVQCARYEYDPASWAVGAAKPLAFERGTLGTHMFHFAYRNVFLEQYRQEIEAAPNITLYVHASVVSLEADASGAQVTHARVKQFNGHEQRFSARRFILCVGGIETARLLLLSDSVHRNGLGNQHDVVGRYYMDHPLIRSGFFVPPDSSVFRRIGFYDTQWVDGKQVMAKLVIDNELMRRERLWNTTAVLFPRPGKRGSDPLRWFFPKGPRFRSPAVGSARTLAMSLKRGKIPPQFLRHVGQAVGGLDDMLFYWWRKNQAVVHHHCPCAHWKNAGVLHSYGLDHGGWSRLDDIDTRFGSIEMLHMTEQAPDPDNRIMLGDKLDGLGCRKVQIRWRWTDSDIESTRRAQDIYVRELTRAGIGKFTMQRDRDVPNILLPSVHHHMGAARMHDDPRQGVVDAHCRIHGVDNVSIASSAVFTTGGYANPTLTIVAFALRITDRIKAELRSA